MLKLSFAIFCTVLSIAMPLMAADKPAMKTTETMTAVPIDGNVFFTDGNGKHAVDPVCGMRITVDAKTATADADGKHYYFCSSGCSRAFSAKPLETIAKLVLPAGVTSMSGGKMMASCAVSGEQVEVTDKTFHQVYNGKDYYFCCNKCPVAFTKNPEKYSKSMADNQAKDKIEMKTEMEHLGHEGNKGH
jgi:YHS domain-containing protein